MNQLAYTEYNTNYIPSVNRCEAQLAVLQEHDDTRKSLTKTTNDLVEVKRESHKRKKLLTTQQHIIQTGPNAYNKVGLCLDH